MKIEIDGGLVKVSANNNTKVIIEEADRYRERHVNVTNEGIIIDLVRDGEVIGRKFFLHEDLYDQEG